MHPAVQSFLRREALALWDREYPIAAIADAIKIPPATVADWAGSRESYVPFVGRLTDRHVPASHRAQFPAYCAKLEQLLRVCAVEQLEAEIDSATRGMAEARAGGDPEAATEIRDRIAQMTRRIELLQELEMEADPL